MNYPNRDIIMISDSGGETSINGSKAPNALPEKLKRSRKPWVYKSEYDRVRRLNSMLAKGMGFAIMYILFDILGHVIGPWFVDHFILFKW